MYGWLDSARFAISLIFLLAASVHDIKSREVPNYIWAAFAPIGSALTLISIALNGWNQTIILAWIVTVAVTIGLSMGLFYLGLFGGADAKALMCLAASMPTQLNQAVIKPLMEAHAPIPLPISTFNNAVLSASLLSIAISIRNLIDLARNGRRIFDGLEHEKLITKAFAFMTGYRVHSRKLRSGKRHYIILEEFSKDEDGRIKRRLKILKRLSISGEGEGEEKSIPSDYDGEVWVTMGLPFIVFITFGFVASILIGDLIFLLINALL
jgi:preflagellin peptidase FlaK